MTAVVAGVVTAVLVHTIGAQLKLQNGVRLLIAIAGFAGGYAIARSTIGVRAKQESRTDRIEREMMSHEYMSLLAEHEPGFRARTRAFIMTLPVTADSSEVTRRAVMWGREQLTPYLMKYLPLTSDTTAAAVADLFRDALIDLRQDAWSCVTFIHGGDDASSPVSRPSKRIADRLVTMMGQVIEEGIRSPHPRVSDATGEALIEELMTSLSRKHGKRTDDVLMLAAEGEKARAQPHEGCRAATSVFSAIAAMPPSKGGPLLRYMMDAQRAQ